MWERTFPHESKKYLGVFAIQKLFLNVSKDGEWLEYTYNIYSLWAHSHDDASIYASLLKVCYYTYFC